MSWTPITARAACVVVVGGGGWGGFYLKRGRAFTYPVKDAALSRDTRAATLRTLSVFAGKACFGVDETVAVVNKAKHRHEA